MTEYRKLICFIVNVMSDMNPVLLKSIQAICFFFVSVHQGLIRIFSKPTFSKVK